jgi:hypothetical protein
MGKCKYCGKDAGFFRSKHDECEAKFRSGLNQINSIVANCFVTNEDFYLKEREIKAIVANSCIDAISLENEYVKVFDQAVDRYLNDSIISTREEQMVARFLQFTGMQQARLNENKSLEKVLQSKVLEDILSGNKPKPRITIAGDFPFMLGKTENLIWLFRNITLHQQKVRREYVGRSSGVSVRIMKGVYYRRMNLFQNRYKVVYELFGGEKGGAPDLTQAEIRRPIISCLRRSLAEIGGVLYNANDYMINKDTDGYIKVNLDDEELYIFEPEKGYVILNESEIYQRIIDMR